MNLNPIKANMTELVLNDYRILFSYKTPVAAVDRRATVGGMPQYYKTSKKWSNTTTRHINQWLGGYNGAERPQEWFDALLAAVK